jgi:ABC-type phosphate/phosphonate transport system substrate-binding protein
MKIFKYFVLLSFLISSLYSQNESKFTFGISTFNNTISNQDRIEKLTINLVEKIKKDYKNDFNVIFYKDEKVLLKDFKERKKIDAIVVNPEVYFENKNMIKEISENPFIYKNSKVNYSQLLLIANKNSKINSLKDLKNKVFMNTQYSQSYSIWLDYLYLKNTHTAYKNIIKNELFSSKPSTALLDVYFNKADFCIIEKDVYENMLILNPSLSKNLMIIEKSPEIFFASFTSIHKEAPRKSVDLINKIVDSKDFKNDFRELLKLINLDSASRIRFEDLTEMENFYEEYKELKKKYN